MCVNNFNSRHLALSNKITKILPKYILLCIYFFNTNTYCGAARKYSERDPKELDSQQSYHHYHPPAA